MVSPVGCLENPELPVITNNWDETGCPPDFPGPLDDVDLADEFVELSALANILNLESSAGGDFIIRDGGILGIVGTMNTAGQVTVEGLLAGNMLHHTGPLVVSPGGAVEAQSLDSDALVQIDDGSLSVNGNYQLTSTLQFLGGLLVADQLDAQSGATVTWSEGEVLADQVTFNAGANVTIGPGGVGASTISNLNGGTLDNFTTVHVLGGQWWINSGATVKNHTILQIEGGDPIIDSTTEVAGTIENTATVLSTATMARINRTRLKNFGTVQVDAGTLDVAGGGESMEVAPDSGVFQIAAGAEVLFGTNLPSQLFTFKSGTAVKGAGFAHVTGTVAVADGDTATAENIHIEGQLAGTGPGVGGTLEISDVFRFTNGLIQGGTVRILPGAELKIEDGSGGATTKVFDTVNLLDNQGLATWTGVGQLWINGGSTFRNAAAATFRIQNAAVMDTTSQASGAFDNLGTLLKTSSGTSRINRTRFNNQGTVQVDAGTLDVSGGGESTGDFQIAAGAEVLFGTNAPTQLYTLKSGTTFSGGGLLHVTGAASVATGATVVAERVQLDGQLIGPGTLSISSLFDWTGGSQSGGRTIVEAGATMNISGSTDKTLTGGHILENHGTATWTGAGKLLINGLAEFRNESAQTFVVANNADMDTTSQASGSFENLGTFRKTTGGVSRINRTRFNNQGLVQAEAGTLDIAGGGASSGDFAIADGAIVQFGTNSPTQLYALQTGTDITGAGTARVTGAVSIGSGQLVTASNFDVDGGTVSGAGTLEVSNRFDWSAGMLSGGTTTVLAAATMNLTGAADKSLTNGHTLDVFGAGTWTGAGSQFISGGSRLQVRSGGSLDIRTDALVDSPTFPAGVVDVQGSLTKSNSSGTTRFARTLLNNSGSVQVSSGTLQLAGSGQSTGAFVVGSGATLEFAAGGLYTLGVGTTISGAGFARVTGSVLVPAGANVSADRVDYVGGLVTGSGALAVNQELQLAGSADKNFDTLTVQHNGTAMWTGAGQLLLNNGAIFNNNAAATFAAENDGTIDTNDFPQGTFNNLGTWIKRNSGGTTRFFRTPLNNAGLMDVQSGTLRLETVGSHSGSFQMAGGTSVQLAVGLHSLNSGAQFGGNGLLRLNGAIAQVPAAAAVSMQNADVTAGALNVDGALTVNGSFNWAGGALSINNAGSIVNNSANTFNASTSATVAHSGAATARFTNAGTFQKTDNTGTTRFITGIAYDNSGVTTVGAASTLQLSGGGTSTAAFHVASGGVLLLDGFTGYTWNAGTLIDGAGVARVTGLVNTPTGVTASVDRLQLFGGTLGQPGVVQVNNDFTWTFGTLSAGTLLIANGASATIAGTFSMTLSGHTLANHGTLVWTSGAISAASSPTIINHLGAVFDIRANASLGGPGTLNNDGLLTKTAGGGASLVGLATTNTGGVQAASGTLQFTGGFSQTAGITSLVGGNLASSTPMNFLGGALTGSGTILGQVNNLGAAVSPGLSAGLLQVTGYAQSPSGLLKIEIGGTNPTQFDRLEASSAATLGGALDVSLLGFRPAPADTFAILSAAGGISGAFANAASGQRLFTSDGLGSFLVYYGAGSPFDDDLVVLSSFFLAADFDEDGDVDGADLAIWQSGFGLSGSPAHTQGNANGDADVDGADFLAWQRQLGAATVSATATVPEPATLLMPVLGVLLMIRRRPSLYRKLMRQIHVP